MDPRAERVQVIVLRAVETGESDLVLQLLSREHGRLPVFVRGARKSKKYGAALEPFSLVEALLAHRVGSDLSTLRGATLLEGFPGLREDLHRLAHAGYATELAHELSRAGQPAGALFSALHDFLWALSRGPATSARLRAVELLLLAGAGLLPELSVCARCGRALPPGEVLFGAAAGGLLCEACGVPGALRLTSGARAVLQQLASRGIPGAEAPRSADGSGRAAKGPAFEVAARLAGPALLRFVVFHLGREPRSHGFLAQVGAPV